MPGSVAMTGASDKAVEAAAEAVHGALDQAAKDIEAKRASPFDHGVGVPERWIGRAALEAAHDPALGRDASVNVGAVLDAIRLTFGKDARADQIADWLEREHREGRLA